MVGAKQFGVPHAGGKDANLLDLNDAEIGKANEIGLS
jgi:hypothetical protein